PDVPASRRGRVTRSVVHGLRILMRTLEDVVIPPVCVHCDRRRHHALPLCRVCLRVMTTHRLGEDEVVTGMPWVRALFRLTPPLHRLTHAFKYRHQRRHIAFLCAWLRRHEAGRIDLVARYDVLVPVPLHASRRRERGYNQSEALARLVGAWGH